MLLAGCGGQQDCFHRRAPLRREMIPLTGPHPPTPPRCIPHPVETSQPPELRIIFGRLSRSVHTHNILGVFFSICK